MSSPECRAVFGDSRCGVDLSSLTTTGTITAVDAYDLKITCTLANTGLALPTGALTFTSGDNDGVTIDIRDYVSSTGVITLHFWPVNDPQVGDTVSAVRGCDHVFATCRDTFANAANFRGEPDIPGSTAYFALSSPSTA